MVLDIDNGGNRVTIKRSVEVQRLIATLVDPEKDEELREESIALASEVDILNWYNVGDALKQSLQLKYIPKIITMTRRKALVELQKAEDQIKALQINDFIWEGSSSVDSRLPHITEFVVQNGHKVGIPLWGCPSFSHL